MFAVWTIKSVAFERQRWNVESLKMSKSTDTHNIQLTNLAILVLKYILEDLDVDLELTFTDGKKKYLIQILLMAF